MTSPLVPIPLGYVPAIARQLERAGWLEDAERMADRVLAVFPKHSDALHIKDIAAAGRGRDELAAVLLDQAIAYGLEVPQYYRNICAIYERLGRLDEALADG